VQYARERRALRKELANEQLVKSEHEKELAALCRAGATEERCMEEAVVVAGCQVNPGRRELCDSPHHRDVPISAVAPPSKCG
jgi:hypothetical protein